MQANSNKTICYDFYEPHWSYDRCGFLGMTGIQEELQNRNTDLNRLREYTFQNRTGNKDHSGY